MLGVGFLFELEGFGFEEDGALFPVFEGFFGVMELIEDALLLFGLAQAVVLFGVQEFAQGACFAFEAFGAFLDIEFFLL